VWVLKVTREFLGLVIDKGFKNVMKCNLRKIEKTTGELLEVLATWTSYDLFVCLVVDQGFGSVEGC
jgi:hypothetical protein